MSFWQPGSKQEGNNKQQKNGNEKKGSGKQHGNEKKSSEHENDMVKINSKDNKRQKVAEPVKNKEDEVN
jgi:hypothetical protein